MKKSSITLSIAILALVFGFYMIAGTGCKDSTDAGKTDDKTEGKETKDDTKEPEEVDSVVVTASENGKKFLVSKYGKEGGWGKMHLGTDGLICAGLMSAPNPMKPAEAPLNEMIDHFLAKQDSSGKWQSPIDRGGLAVYESATVILALKKAIELDPKHPKKAEIENAIKKGVDYLLLAQVDETPAFEGDTVVKAGDESFNGAHYGGWGYGHNRSGKSPANLSTTHFAMEALYESGMKDDPKVKEAFKKAIGFLEYCQNRGEKKIVIPAGIDKSEADVTIQYGNDGGAIYGPGIAKPKNIVKDGYEVTRSYGSMTYVLMKEYVFAGLPKTDERVQAAFNWLKKAENYTFAKNAGYEDKPYAGLYYQLYAASKALTVMGEDIFVDSKGEEHNWRKDMQKQILEMQKEDGSWVNDKDEKWMEGNPILATAYTLTAIGNTMK